MRRPPPAAAAAADVVAVVAFVLAGRRSHADEAGLAGVLAGAGRTALPFLVGLAVGWAVARAWREPGSVKVGAVVWAVTVVVGMLGRTVLERVPPVSFVVVATTVLGALLLGWRLAAAGLSRRA